jgi:hypothetical protein
MRKIDSDDGYITFDDANGGLTQESEENTYSRESLEEYIRRL